MCAVLCMTVVHNDTHAHGLLFVCFFYSFVPVVISGEPHKPMQKAAR